MTGSKQAKLLPVGYFMVTFTLPYELRPLVWYFQEQIYAMLFACAIGTLREFGLNPKHLGAEMGMTAVLHIQTRRYNFHPHLHSIVPGSAGDSLRRSRANTSITYSTWPKSCAPNVWKRTTGRD